MVDPRFETPTKLIEVVAIGKQFADYAAGRA